MINKNTAQKHWFTC